MPHSLVPEPTLDRLSVDTRSDRFDSLGRLIDIDALAPVFQPIVDLRDGAIHSSSLLIEHECLYEALPAPITHRTAVTEPSQAVRTLQNLARSGSE